MWGFEKKIKPKLNLKYIHKISDDSYGSTGGWQCSSRCGREIEPRLGGHRGGNALSSPLNRNSGEIKTMTLVESNLIDPQYGISPPMDTDSVGVPIL